MARLLVLSMTLLAGAVAGIAANSLQLAPGPRIGHSLVFDPIARAVLLLDGYSWIRAVSPTEPPAVTEVWQWDGRAWSRRVTSAGPASRTMGRLTYDRARQRLVMYGGRVGRTETPSDETWELDATTWRRVSGEPAGPTVHVEMVYDAARNTTIRFGGALRGSRGFEWPTDTWAWSGAAWIRVATDGPPGRAAAGMVYDSRRQEIVLFGGQGEAPGPGQEQPVFNDTWIWNGRAWRLATTEGPPARAFHAMTFDERRGVALLHGGNFRELVFDDLWAWDGARWTKMQPAGATPGARRLHSIAYDAARDRTVLYGGSAPRPGGGTDVYGDVWEWDGRKWMRKQGQVRSEK